MIACFRCPAWIAVLVLTLRTEAGSPGAEAPNAAEIPNAPTSAPAPLTLAAAVDLATVSNPTLRAATARLDAALGRAYQARRWTNPELEWNVEELPVNRGNGLPDSIQTVGVAQTVPWPGKKSLDGRIGDAEAELLRNDWEMRRRELVRDVKVAFWELLASSRMVDVAKELVEVARVSAQTARQRVEAGAAADQELLRAEVPLDQARTVLAAYDRDRVAAREKLAALLTLTNTSEIHLQASLDSLPNLAIGATAPEQWLPEHPSIRSAQSLVRRSELAAHRARLEPYPDVRLGFAGGRDGSSDASIVQMRVSLPLPILDRSKGRRQEASANLRGAEAEQRSVELQLRRDWNTARQRLRTATTEVELYRDRILPKASEALRLVRAGFEQGKFGLIDLIDTQRTWAEVRLTYQQRLLTLHTAVAELEAIIGSATP